MGRAPSLELTLLFVSAPELLSSYLGLLGSPGRLFWEPMKVHDIRWNFEKFLVGPDGIPIMRWYHRTTVNSVKMDILTYMRRRAVLEAKG